MRHRFSLTLVLEIFTMLFLFPSSISYSQEKALAKLIEDSNVIITGSVKNIKYEWEKGNIWTYVSIERSQILKGDNKLNKIKDQASAHSVQKQFTIQLLPNLLL